MSTITNPISGIITALKRLGNTETIDNSGEEIIMLHPVLADVLNKIENGNLKKETEKSANTNGGSNKGKGGIRKKYETPKMSVEEMTPEKLEIMSKILKRDDYEIGQ